MFSLKATENCKHCNVWKMLRNRKKKKKQTNEQILKLGCIFIQFKIFNFKFIHAFENIFLISSLNTKLMATTAKKDWKSKKRDNLLTAKRARMLRLRGFLKGKNIDFLSNTSFSTNCSTWSPKINSLLNLLSWKCQIHAQSDYSQVIQTIKVF